MRYRNEHTGAVIETKARVSGGDWVPVQPDAPEAESTAEEKSKKKGRTDA